MMEKKISKLFDYQRFENNAELAAVISESENRFAQALSDEDLFMVAAAGEIHPEGPKAPDRSENASGFMPGDDPAHR